MPPIRLWAITVIVVGCSKPAPISQTARRAELEVQLPPGVKAQLQPKIAWGGCWAMSAFGRTPTLATAHRTAGLVIAPIEFPTTVIVDDWADGRPDLVQHYRYDQRGNVTSLETDEGADGLLDERVVLARDDNGAITRATRESLFPFAQTDVQTFSLNPYGYLVATDDFYKKRAFAGNEVSPVAVGANGRVTMGALAFTRDAAGEVVEAQNTTLGITRTIARDATTTRVRTSTGSSEITIDGANRIVARTLMWDGGRVGHRSTYRYADREVEIEESDLPSGACTAKWHLVGDARGELISVTRDTGCDGFLDKTVQSTVDSSGRLVTARFENRSVTLQYNGDLVQSARFTHGPTYDETIAFEYDAAGRVVKQQRPNETLRWEYDGHGRVTVATMESASTTPPASRTIRYEYAAPPLNLAGAPRCEGDRMIAGLVMASELEMPTLDDRAPALFQDDMPLNLPSVAPSVPAARFAPAPLRELEAAIAKALAREHWTPVRYELLEEGRTSEGTRAGPVVERDVVECAGSRSYYARDKNDVYFKLEIEKRCKTVSTSTNVDPLTCQWGTQPPQHDLVLHVPKGASEARPRKLVVDLPTCINYTGQPLPVP